MSKTLEDLRAAREALGPILGRRGPTTDAELDECVGALEELKRACARLPALPPSERAICSALMNESFNEVIARLKNRSRRLSTPPPKVER